MTLAPLLAAPPMLQAHLAAATIALCLTPVMWLRRKGTRSHRFLGWIWVVVMTVVALTSFWISELRAGHFSPIHLLAVVTLIGLPAAIYYRRRGNIAGHRRAMMQLTFGLVGAGLFTILPARLLGRVFFGP